MGNRLERTGMIYLHLDEGVDELGQVAMEMNLYFQSPKSEYKCGTFLVMFGRLRFE
jgi:hypothetical protein